MTTLTVDRIIAWNLAQQWRIEARKHDNAAVLLPRDECERIIHEEVARTLCDCARALEAKFPIE